MTSPSAQLIVSEHTEKALTQAVGALNLDGAPNGVVWSKWGAATAAIIDPGTYACISTLAEEIGSAEWRVVNKATGETLGSSSDIHSTEPLTRLLHDVSYREDGTSPFYIWALMLYTFGEAYWQLVFDQAGTLTALDWWNSLHAHPDTSPGYIESFTYSGSGINGYRRLPPRAVVYDRLRNNLLTDFGGYAPVMAAIGANRIQIGQAAGKAAMAHFRNNGMPEAILSPKQGEKWERREEKFISNALANNKGAGNKGKAFVFPYPFDSTIFELPDLKKWAELLRAFEPDIYRVYRVPPPVVGDVTTPYQNSDENRINYHGTIAKRLRAIAGVVNTNLIRLLYGQYAQIYFEFELSQYTHDDPEEIASAQDLYEKGLIEANEYRVARGWKEAEWLKGLRLDPVTGAFAPITQPLAAPATTADPMAGAATGDPAEADKGITPESLCVALDVGAHPDLVELQQRVKMLAGDAPFKANDPTTFHVTLAYAPVVDEDMAAAAVEAVRAIPVPELVLPVGSLRAFDRVGENAVHFKVRANSALRDYQAQVAEALTDAGIQLSSYSDPSRYQPHITMGYITGAAPSHTVNTSLSVPAKGVVVWRGDKTAYSSADAAQVDEVEAFAKYFRNGLGSTTKRAFTWKYIDAETGGLIELESRASDSPEATKSIIGKWRTAILARQGVTDYATKSFDDLPEPTREAIKSWRALKVEEADVQAAAAEHYAAVLGQKAVSQTRSKFMTECLRLMQNANQGTDRKSTFRRNMDVLITRYSSLAMQDGYSVGGVGYHDLSADDEKWLKGHGDRQRAFIANVADRLFADDELTQDEIAGKPEMWWNLSVSPAYNEGMTRASKNGLGEWNWGPTSDSCPDCTMLNGRRYLMSEWLELLGGVLPPCNKTDCGGFRCKCRVRPARGKRTPGDLPTLRGRRKAVAFGFDLEVYTHA